MKVLNRIVASLLFVLLLLAFILFAVFPAEVALVAENGAEWLERWAADMETNAHSTFLLIRIGIVIASAIIFGLLLWFEVRSPATRTVTVKTKSGVQAQLAISAVVQQLAWHIDQLPGVIHVRPKITHGKDNTINIVLDLETSPEVDVPTKTDEVISVTRQAIRDRMGLNTGGIEVNIRHAPYPEDRAQVSG